MKTLIVKIVLAAVVLAAMASSPARALPGIDPGVASGTAPKAEKI